jgi:glycosyltransferase involved in cell wall biosynthesis
MVIGIDAGALSVEDQRLTVGVFRVVHNLLKELSYIDTENDYRLYSFRPIPEWILSQYSATMHNVVLKPAFGWFHWRLPTSLLQHPVDLFLGVSQALPRGVRHQIAFIYDLGFLEYPHLYPGSQRSLAQKTHHAVNAAEKIITISEFSKQQIEKTYHCDPQKIFVSYPGVDERFTQKGPVYRGKRPYCLHVGSLKPGKNIPALITGFSQFLRSSGEDMDLLLIGGDRWMDPGILPMITATKLEDRVKLLGFVPDEIMPEYYRGATCFVTLSLSEGFCLPIAEAMACGVPVVASNKGSLPEVSSEPQLLSDPDDLALFSSNLMHVIRDQEFRNTVIAKGIGKSSGFNWKTFAEGVYAVIASFNQ